MTMTSETGPQWRMQTGILTTIEERYDTYHHGPCVEEDKGQRRIHHGEIRAKVFIYVIAICRNNVLWIAFL
jgi:hypothetical protein